MKSGENIHAVCDNLVKVIVDKLVEIHMAVIKCVQFTPDLLLLAKAGIVYSALSSVKVPTEDIWQ